jgi:hypothetical protein
MALFVHRPSSSVGSWWPAQRVFAAASSTGCSPDNQCCPYGCLLAAAGGGLSLASGTGRYPPAPGAICIPAPESMVDSGVHLAAQVGDYAFICWFWIVAFIGYFRSAPGLVPLPLITDGIVLYPVESR